MYLTIEGNYNPNLLQDEFQEAGLPVMMSYYPVVGGYSLELDFDPVHQSAVETIIAAHNPSAESLNEKHQRRYTEAVNYLKNENWDAVKTAILALPVAQRDILVPLAKGLRSLAIIVASLDKEIN